MINLEKKLNRKSASPPLPFKKTYPCTVLPPPFLIFSDSPSEGGNQTLLLPFRKKCVCVRGWGFPNYELAKKTPE